MLTRGSGRDSSKDTENANKAVERGMGGKETEAANKEVEADMDGTETEAANKEVEAGMVARRLKLLIKRQKQGC